MNWNFYMTSALDSVMDQAAAAADATSNLPSTQVAGTALTQTTAPAALTLDDLADSSGMVVDAYLSVKDAGLRIDTNPYFQKAKGRINMKEVAVIMSVRANTGGNTTFIKSYDGLKTSQGENFQQATARLQANNTKVDGPYRTVEVPFLLGEDVPGAKKGQRLGITPAITGVKFWNAFYQDVREKGFALDEVEVEIECLPQRNKNNNEWGVVGFKLIGKAK
jgi:hypothetical protein